MGVARVRETKTEKEIQERMGPTPPARRNWRITQNSNPSCEFCSQVQSATKPNLRTNRIRAAEPPPDPAVSNSETSRHGHATCSCAAPGGPTSPRSRRPSVGHALPFPGHGGQRWRRGWAGVAHLQKLQAAVRPVREPPLRLSSPHRPLRRRNKEKIWERLCWRDHGYSKFRQSVPVLALLWVGRPIWCGLYCFSSLFLWWLNISCLHYVLVIVLIN